MKAHRLNFHVALGIMAGLLTAGLVPASRASAQSSTPGVGGSTIFSTYCAACHGTSAKGDGPLASSLRTRPADLTQIAKRNGGTFPAAQVERTIEGRSPVKGHGGPDMPVWGDAFAKSSDTMPADQKIQRLVRYLESIQVKP
jgi:mono/diheme cytochrome c family protein